MFLKRYISIIRKTWNRFGICWLKASALFRTSIPSRANTSSCETPWNNSFDERFSTRRCSKSRTRFTKSKKTYRRREKKKQMTFLFVSLALRPVETASRRRHGDSTSRRRDRSGGGKTLAWRTLVKDIGSRRLPSTSSSTDVVRSRKIRRRRSIISSRSVKLVNDWWRRDWRDWDARSSRRNFSRRRAKRGRFLGERWTSISASRLAWARVVPSSTNRNGNWFTSKMTSWYFFPSVCRTHIFSVPLGEKSCWKTPNRSSWLFFRFCDDEWGSWLTKDDERRCPNDRRDRRPFCRASGVDGRSRAAVDHAAALPLSRRRGKY